MLIPSNTSSNINNSKLVGFVVWPRHSVLFMKITELQTLCKLKLTYPLFILKVKQLLAATSNSHILDFATMLSK